MSLSVTEVAGCHGNEFCGEADTRVLDLLLEFCQHSLGYEYHVPETNQPCCEYYVEYSRTF